MTKPTIWIFSIEPLPTRYTGEWHEHIPKLLTTQLGDKFNVVQVDGVQMNSTPTPGAFLNFSDTNYWKSSQLCKFLELHNQGLTSPDDHFLFTDAWNPTVIQLKYMSSLLGFNWTLHGQWHAGSYDENDFLGRIVGNTPWVRNAEQSFFDAFDHNYFATEFHIDLFTTVLLEDYPYDNGKIIRTGWPMEYMINTLKPYANLPKRDLILFPHRIAPEKQVEIFRDLTVSLPQYEFIVCQDFALSKSEYHALLGLAKMVFSANKQETLGISCFEGVVLDAIPFVPDRLSYSEMYLEEFKYPSEWTEDYSSYLIHKSEIIARIVDQMTNYATYEALIVNQLDMLETEYFSADQLINQFTKK